MQSCSVTEGGGERGEDEDYDKRGEQKTECERRQLRHKTPKDKTAPECANIPWPADPKIGGALLRSCRMTRGIGGRLKSR